MRGAAFALAVLMASSGFAKAELVGDAANGEKQFRVCKACHAVGEDARHKVGPALNGVYLGPVAAQDGFKYSKALMALGEDGTVWTEEALHAFLIKPRDFARGTKMSYPGMKKEQDRADVIAYLATFSDASGDTGDGFEVAPEILAIAGDVEYGEYLSSECTACHRADGADDGIPSITQWAEADFVTAMHSYKEKVREHPVMNMVAGRLGDEEIAALAAYFATSE